MGAGGKLKLPTHLRPVTDQTPAGTAAETTPRDEPRKPSSVEHNDALSALWDEIVPELVKSGLVSAADGPAIELTLRHYRLAILAGDQIGAEVVVPDHGHGGVKKNPAEAVFRAESDMFLRYADKLGMVWMARARTPAAKGRDDGDANPFAATGS